MRVDWLSLVDFRSYQTLEWSPDRETNILVGPNGAGKTNALEAIGYLASLKSFRSVPDQALITEGADSAVVRSQIAGEGRRRLVEIELARRGGRKAQVDKTRLRRSSDLLGVIRVVSFLPEDLDLVKRGPAYRRGLLDDVAVQLWPSAYLDQSEYDRSVRQRNAFLKAGQRDDVTLSVWDSRLSQAGGRVLARRALVIEALTPLLAGAYQTIAGESAEVALTYEGSWLDTPGLSTASAGEFAQRLARALESCRRNDYERRMTTVGPHRDDPGFSLGGREARLFGSQGEQRTMALAVKLAAHAAVADAVGEPPVLLLDDVFSELDPRRASALAGALPEGAQTFITSARPEDVPLSAKTWSVSEGRIS